MSKPLLIGHNVLSGIFAMAAATSLQAAELKVIAGGSMTASLNALAPQFEKATGHKLVIHFNSTPNIITRVNAGTPFDVVVVPVDVFKDAAAKARFAPGPPSISRASAMASSSAPARRSPTSRRRTRSRRPCSPRHRSPSCRQAPPAPTSRKCSSASASPRR